jgi:hypothetical protein
MNKSFVINTSTNAFIIVFCSMLSLMTLNMGLSPYFSHICLIPVGFMALICRGVFMGNVEWLKGIYILGCILLIPSITGIVIGLKYVFI